MIGPRFIRDATDPDASAPNFASEDAARPGGTDRVPKPVILARFTAFFRGDWEPLLRAALAEASAPVRPPTNTTDDLPRRGLSAPPA